MEKRKPRVYVPMVPSRWDSTIKRFIPIHNLDPAKEFGEIIICLPPDANRLHSAPLVTALREKMDGFQACDFICCLGDPTIIAAAAAIGSRLTGGKLNVLKWDRRMSDYINVSLTEL